MYVRPCWTSARASYSGYNGKGRAEGKKVKNMSFEKLCGGQMKRTVGRSEQITPWVVRVLEVEKTERIESLMRREGFVERGQ